MARPGRGDVFVLQFAPGRHLIAAQWVLFLDFDGTLVDIAATPQDIVIPQDLRPLLEKLIASFESRVCIVSGRSLSDIKHYLNNLAIDIIAEHGAVQCLQGYEVTELPLWPPTWNKHLLTLDQCIPNLVVEKKQTAVALHYRQQPELAPEVMKLAQLLRNHAASDYMIVNSNMTTEIRRSSVDKGTAIKTAMATPRYYGKKPIFIADDVTDFPGFDVVRAMDGFALNVHQEFAGRPSEVRRWLAFLVSEQQAA